MEQLNNKKVLSNKIGNRYKLRKKNKIAVLQKIEQNKFTFE